MKAVNPLLKVSGAVLAAGIMFGVGVRISQWLVPAPAVRIALCDSSAEDAACLVVEDVPDVPAGLVAPELTVPPYPSPTSI